MPQNRTTVIHQRKRNDNYLPDWVNPGIVLLEDIRRRGILDEVSSRLRLLRTAGGYVSVDLLVFLVMYFASGLKIGLKSFSRRLERWQSRIAALVGRRSMPSQSSVSRMLASADEESVREFSNWLLLEACEPREVLRHPASSARCTLGQTWNFFDWDPTVTAIRQRGLPAGDDLPSPTRHSRHAKPGYAGRKRGNVQFRRGVLQHAGSSLWLSSELSAGNEGGFASLRAAAERVGQVCRYAELEPDHAVLRADGEVGHPAYLAAIQTRGIRFLTRYVHYDFARGAEAQHYLRHQARWYRVPDSGSGPTRYAAELGDFALPVGEPGEGEDGAPTHVRTRLIVTRYESEKKRGAGWHEDGYQWELFATDLPKDAWPAAEAVSAYYGRSGAENRYAQEDRELELDRIFSFEPAGQELAAVLGLFVWNLQVCRGLELARTPHPPEVGIERHVEVAAPVAWLGIDGVDGESESSDNSPEISAGLTGIPSDGEAPVASPSEQAPSVDDIDGVIIAAPDAQPEETTPVHEGHSQPRPSSPEATLIAAPQALLDGVRGAGGANEPPSQNDAGTTSGAMALPTSEALRSQLLDDLSLANWKRRLARLGPGWARSDDGLKTVCPTGQELSLSCVGLTSGGSARVWFGGSVPVCSPCPLRASCSRSTAAYFRKLVGVPVPWEVGVRLRETVEKLRKETNPDAAGLRKGPPSQLDPTPLQPTLNWSAPTEEDTSGALAARSELLVPTELRRTLRSHALAMQVVIKLSTPRAPAQAKAPGLCCDAAARQKRRRTWSERLHHYALVDKARLEVEFFHPGPLKAILEKEEREKAV